MGDEWIGSGYYLSPIHPLFIPSRDEWVKVDPHSSPFPIHPTCPALCKPGGWRLLCNSDRLYPTLLCCIHKTTNDQDFCEQELCFDKNDQVI